MKAGGKTEDATYDVAEIRARMALVFSLSELRGLGLRLGMAEVSLDRGAKEAAREIVRFAEKGGRLGALLEALREARPLVEWPEPVSSVAASSPYAPPELPGEGEAPARLDSPGSLVGGPLAPGPAQGEEAEASPSAGFPSAASPVAPPAGSAPEGPAVRDPFAPPPAAWPGTAPFPAARPEPKGLDPRILVVVSATMLLAAVAAFAAGRALSARPAPEAASSAPPPDKAPRDPESPSARVAAAFGRTLGNVARICEVPRGALAATNEEAAALALAFERCGPPPIAPRLGDRRDPAPRGNDPSSVGAAPDKSRAPGAGRPAAPRPATEKPAPAAPAAEEGCLASCQSSHQRCRGACGPEPTLSSKYGEFQACQSKCLSAASKCRLACSAAP